MNMKSKIPSSPSVFLKCKTDHFSNVTLKELLSEILSQTRFEYVTLTPKRKI